MRQQRQLQHDAVCDRIPDAAVPAPRPSFSVLGALSSFLGSRFWALAPLFFVLCSLFSSSRFSVLALLFFILCSLFSSSRFSVLGSRLLCSLFFVLCSRLSNNQPHQHRAVRRQQPIVRQQRRDEQN